MHRHARLQTIALGTLLIVARIAQCAVILLLIAMIPDPRMSWALTLAGCAAVLFAAGDIASAVAWIARELAHLRFSARLDSLARREPVK